MFPNAIPTETSGRVPSSVQPQSAQPSAWTATPSAAHAAGNPASPVTFPSDIVQVSFGARNMKRSADLAAKSSSSGPTQESGPSTTQDVARVREAIAELQKKTTAVTFAFSEDGSRVIVKIINKSTGDVVRQLPPEEVLKLAERMDTLRGMLFEKTS